MRIEQVEGRWVHVHEEDTEAGSVYRREGADLPPSRGRTTLELRSDGTYAGTVPGPADAPQDAGGTWSLDGDRITLSDGRSARELDVVSVEQDRLVVRAGDRAG